MPLDIGAAVNSAITWVGKSPVIKCAVGNPFMAALVITAMAAVVIMGVYHYKIGGDNYKLACRAGFYMYIAVLCVLYLHHTVLMHNIQESSGKSQVQQVYNDLNLRSAAFGGGPQPEGHFDINAALRTPAPYTSEALRTPAPYTSEAHTDVHRASAPEHSSLRSDNVLQHTVAAHIGDLGSLTPVHVEGRARP